MVKNLQRPLVEKYPQITQITQTKSKRKPQKTTQGQQAQQQRVANKIKYAAALAR